MLFVGAFSTAQDIYVSSDEYVYVTDDVIFSNDHIRLESPTSFMYLRDNAQLMQNLDSKNSDVGSLSVFQHQRTGIYEYNYWCSPVGFSTNDVTQYNGEFINSTIADLTVPLIYQPASLANNEINASVYGTLPGYFDYDSTATEMSTFWLYSLISGGGYDDWKHVTQGYGAPYPSVTTLPAGYGFTMKGSPTVMNRLDFRGKPNNGTMLVNCYFNGTDSDPNSGSDQQVETLIGNPYPSALDLKLFLINPTNAGILNGTVYRWEQAAVGTHVLTGYEGGYSTYVPGNPADLNDNGTFVVAPFLTYDNQGGNSGNTGASGTDYTNNNAGRYAAIGQGFNIRTADNGGAPFGGDAVINNSMRVYFPEDSDPNGNGSIFGRTVNTDVRIESHNGVDYQDIMANPTVVPTIKIHTSLNGNGYREVALAFRDNSTVGFEPMFDGQAPLVLDTDAYLGESDYPLTINSFEYTIDKMVPFSFNANSTDNNFSVTVKYLMDVDPSINIYMYDSVENTYTDIKNGVFEVSIPQGTNSDGRYYVVFQDSTLGVDDVVIEDGDLTVFIVDNELVVSNPNLIDINELTLYDVSGKLIFNKVNIEGSENRYPVGNLSTAMYLAKVDAGAKSKTFKLMKR